jgi:anaerobic selenocysteine-containing dehydrogenase
VGDLLLVDKPMTERSQHSICRICYAFCSVVVDVDRNGRIANVTGDKDSPGSRGYICIKGRQAAEIHHGSSRVLQPLKRQPNGTFTPVSLDTALDEIASNLAGIRRRHGGESIAVYRGGAAYHTTANQMQQDWLKAIGSQSLFSSLTIDQSAKIVTADRLGSWNAGRQSFYDSDVMLLVGANPLVSLGVLGFPVFNPVKSLKEAKARGMKLIVIDPRRTETAQHADLFLQPPPGEDPSILAGMLRIILEEHWIDREFCSRYVAQIEELARSVSPFTPDRVEQRTGIPAASLYAATKMFALEARRGNATAGTGPSMSPRSNLTDHLVECLNVLCGRFLREGEKVPNAGILSPSRSFRAEVNAPTRSWNNAPMSRLGSGMIAGEKPTGTLADEILTPGPGQIRALIVDGGNPLASVPDQPKMKRACEEIELLVAIEPYMTNTARMAHYIIPPVLMYEMPAISCQNPDWETSIGILPFQQYSAKVIDPPEGAQVLDDWAVFWELAKRMGLPLEFAGVPLNMDVPPTTDELLDLATRNGRVPLAVVKRYPSGHLFESGSMVEPGCAENSSRFEVAPFDIVAELTEVAAEGFDPLSVDGVKESKTRFPFRLSSRRMREVMNSQLHKDPVIRKRVGCNPAFMNPADLSELGLTSGDRVEIISEYGRIKAAVEFDENVRRGVVSISHSWGALPGEAEGTEPGFSVNMLISDQLREPINAMPRMSGVPVQISPCD